MTVLAMSLGAVFITAVSTVNDGVIDVLRSCIPAQIIDVIIVLVTVIVASVVNRGWPHAVKGFTYQDVNTSVFGFAVLG